MIYSPKVGVKEFIRDNYPHDKEFIRQLKRQQDIFRSEGHAKSLITILAEEFAEKGSQGIKEEVDKLTKRYGTRGTFTFPHFVQEVPMDIYSVIVGNLVIDTEKGLCGENFDYTDFKGRINDGLWPFGLVIYNESEKDFKAFARDRELDLFCDIKTGHVIEEITQGKRAKMYKEFHRDRTLSGFVSKRWDLLPALAERYLERITTIGMSKPGIAGTAEKFREYAEPLTTAVAD